MRVISTGKATKALCPRAFQHLGQRFGNTSAHSAPSNLRPATCKQQVSFIIDASSILQLCSQILSDLLLLLLLLVVLSTAQLLQTQ